MRRNRSSCASAKRRPASLKTLVASRVSGRSGFAPQHSSACVVDQDGKEVGVEAADSQVWPPVQVEVTYCNRRRIGRADVEAPCRLEAPIPVAEPHRNASRTSVGNDKIKRPIAIEVANRHASRKAANRNPL